MPGGNYAHWFIQLTAASGSSSTRLRWPVAYVWWLPDNDWQCPARYALRSAVPEAGSASCRSFAAGLAAAYDGRGWLINAACIYPLGGGEHELSSLQPPVEDFHDLANFGADLALELRRR